MNHLSPEKKKKNKQGQETAVAYSWLNPNCATQTPDAFSFTSSVTAC